MKLIFTFFEILMKAIDFVSLKSRRLNHIFNHFMPKGLYVRSLIIVMMPTFVLLSVTTYIFFERHWQLVTEQLAKATAREVAAIGQLYEANPTMNEILVKAAKERLDMVVEFLPQAPLPPITSRPFFDPLDTNLQTELALTLKRAFWIDTIGRSTYVEIRVQLYGAQMRVIARRGHSYASSSPIFIAWLLATSLVVLTIALLFLRNQIRPILMLAEAAQAFGKGRDLPNFKPRGAREVRAASLAFIEMKKRIERQIDQRTMMLAGVSHDLRTILTRFKLELTFLKDSDEKKALQDDVLQMEKMVETYLNFAKGVEAESPVLTNVKVLLDEIKSEKERVGHSVSVIFRGEMMAIVRPQSFKRAITNLVANAVKYATLIEINAYRDVKYLMVTVDDNGTGIPETLREEVFKPFYRVDSSRNLNETGTGLGLSISRDAIRAHGGDITLETSPLGGVRAVVRLPL